MAKITRGSDNVFADIGMPNADAHMIKAGLVTRIADLIEAAGMTQMQAAERLNMSQPDVSKMLRGQFRPISLERLMQCLVALGSAVTIDVQTATKANKPAIRVVSEAPKRKRKREMA